jgi:all-trans-retinol 13,14-reductase
MHIVEDNNRVISGQLYILISFTPWILYWVLTGFTGELGVFAGFAVSLVITTSQLLRREYNLMDLASITYFSVALIGVFILRIEAFVEESGFLGYFALFLMALFSIVVKQPFTLQVSKRDYPEVYWRDERFLLTNQVITLIWTMLFLLNSIVYLVLGFPLNTVVANTLVIIGVLFSAVYPLKAPARQVYRDFAKYDWRVSVEPGKPREEGEYDVVIVGAGIGGLTCGAILSKHGYRVLILEQHFQVGGYCSSFTRRGFVFNTGVEDISGLWEKGPVMYLLRELGLRREDLFVENTRRIIYKGRVIDVPNDPDQLVELLSDLFPSERENIQLFFNEAKKAYEECYRDTRVYGAPLPPELIVKVFGEKKLLDYPREHPHFYEWMNKTYRDKLDEYFHSEDLKTLLCSLIGYIGVEPRRVSAGSALTASLSYFLKGGYYPKGGAQFFAETLRKYIEEHGGGVLLRHRVDKILVEDNKVVGVKCGDKVFRAPIVVANANAKSVFLKLVGREHLDEEFVKYIESLKMSPSAFMVFLGVGMDLSKYPTIIVDLDNEIHIVINSNADPTLAPAGKSSITITTLANYHDFPERKTREYYLKKKELAEEIIKKTEKIIPGISKHIVVQDAATPKTFERYTSMPEGAIYSFDQSIETKRPYFKTPIKGLYLVGASTFPGGGVEGVVISGLICAHDIMNWKHTNTVEK